MCDHPTRPARRGSYTLFDFTDVPERGPTFCQCWYVYLDEFSEPDECECPCHRVVIWEGWGVDACTAI